MNDFSLAPCGRGTLSKAKRAWGVVIAMTD